MKQKNKLEQTVSTLLKQLEINTNEDGLVETPARVSKMYGELLEGYHKDPADVFKTFEIGSFSGLVVVADIQFYSLCEHHMIPFFGRVNIGYVPDNKILGLSKFARLVNIFARRLQVQERLTEQLGDAIMQHLKPKGVVVSIEAEHLCMSMRGVNKPGATTKTLITKGVFNEDQHHLDNFFAQIKKGV